MLCKGNIWVERGVIWGEGVVYMDVIVWMCFIWGSVGVWRGFIGLVWNLGGGYECILLGEIGGLWLDFGVWFYCVCWDEVDNALRKGRGLPKNVNRGDVYKYKNS